jgi:hypothetical protein
MYLWHSDIIVGCYNCTLHFTEFASVSIVGQLNGYARFAFGLRRFLGQEATAELGREVIRQRLRDRESNFLTFARRAIYENARSPYLSLLRMAGCEPGDLERMVRADGIEKSLERLRDAGVYVTIEEFKGFKPLVRGSVSLQRTPRESCLAWVCRRPLRI